MRFYYQAWVCLFAVGLVFGNGLFVTAARCASTETLFTYQTPALQNVSDGSNVNYELGTKIESGVAGEISAIRFWKSSADNGVHIGRVWNSSGQQLASVTFSNESGSGWQQQSLAAPLKISANTVYVVTVNTGSTRYATSNDGLDRQVTNGDLRSVVGNNGVYGPPGRFPTNTWNGSNYFRDVVFSKGTASTKQLSISSTGLNLGSVSLGGSATHSVTLSNTGNSTLTVSNVSIYGPAFTDSGIPTPMILTAGQTATLNVKFAPGLLGVHNGGISISSDASSTPTKIILSGVGVASATPEIAVVPGNINFGNVTVGVSNTQTVRISNPGTTTLVISQATSASGEFAVSGQSIPLSIAAGQSATFNVRFSPTRTGATSMDLALVSNASGSALQIPVSGTGVQSSLSISANPSSLSFGDVAVGSTSGNDTVTLSNTGNSSLQITRLNLSGSAFHLSGINLPVNLSPGQNASFQVDFAPTGAGNSSGSISVASTASQNPSVALSGTGTSQVAHSVVLDWSGSSSSVVGYNVYRSTSSGAYGSPVNASPVAGTSYTDSSIQAGQTYYYVTTAVNSSGEESVHSNESSVRIP